MDTHDEHSSVPESTAASPHLFNNSSRDEEVTQRLDLSMNIPDDVKTHTSDNSQDQTCIKIHEDSMPKEQSNTEGNEDDSLDVSSAATSSQVPAVEKIGDEHQIYECPCGESFFKTTELAAHKRWSCKLVEKKCQCDVCKGWFAHEQSLRRHMKHAHGGIFPCDSCSLRFHNKMKLTRHWMEEHFDEKLVDKKLKCFICSKAQFDSKYELECHLLAHKYGKQRSTTSITPNQETFGTQSVSQSQATAQTPQHYFHGPASHPLFPFGPWMHHRHRSLQHHFPSPAGPNGPFGVFGRFRHPPPHWEQTAMPSDVLPPSSHPAPPPPSPPEMSHHDHPNPPPPPQHPPPPPPPPSPPEQSHHDHPYPPLPPQYPSHPHPPSSYASSFFPPQHEATPPFQPFHPFDPKPFPSFPPPPPPPPPPHPHHNHHIPPYFPMHAYPNMKKFYKHQNKMKWKNYFKSMMSHIPSHWFAARPGSGASDHHPQNAHQDHSAKSSYTKDSTSEDGMVTCEFCGETVHLKYILCHKRRGCPVLCVHRCTVCGKAFASQNILLRHMSRQGHMNPSDLNKIIVQGDGESSSISGLQEKLKTVLNFPKAGASDEKKAQHIQSIMSEPIQSKLIPKISITKASDDMASNSEESMKDAATSQSSKISYSIDDTGSERALMIDENLSHTFTCFVCRCTMKTKSDIEHHLLDHLAHVESVQKVQEWKEKSAKYFLDKDISEVDSTSSFGDTNELSSTTSIMSEFDCSSNISSHLSSFGNAVSETEKWLKPHGKYKHTKLKRQVFPCDVCSETFAFRKDLHYHMKDKHKDYTLDCPVCNKSFSWKNRAKFYERHMKSHYGVAVFKHKCHLCGKTFLENHKLQAHMSKHKTELLHTCSTCGKGYGNKSSLIRHQRKHTGDKPHQCEVCKETFWEKRELIRHSASHTGTAPFVCSYCGRGFTLKTSLMKHVKRKHP